MTTMRAARRRRNLVGSPAWLVAFLLVVVGITVASLWAGGVITLDHWFGPSREGLVAVPAPSRPIPAYTKVTRDFLLDQNGNLSFIYLPPDAVTPEMYVQLSDILGRVTKKPKPPGYVFTEADFFSEG